MRPEGALFVLRVIYGLFAAYSALCVMRQTIDIENGFQLEWLQHIGEGVNRMLIQTRTITVKAGYADQVVQRFSRPDHPMAEIPGFIDLSVMVKKARKNEEQEEVVVLVRWKSEEAWKTWEKSPAHIEGHRNARHQEKPDFILSTVVSMYEVKAVTLPKAQAQS